jgi:hypothetical protein
VAKTVCSILTAAEYYHPVYAQLVEVHFEMEEEDQAYSRQLRRQLARQARCNLKRTREGIENKGSSEKQKAPKLTSR